MVPLLQQPVRFVLRVRPLSLRLHKEIYMKLRLSIVVALVVLVLPLIAKADAVITVSPTIAPNIFGSPSFPTWESNAISALQAGVPAFGNPASPTYYYQTTTTTPGGIIVTNFPSWMGQADPGTVFGPAYANELGNRAHFSIHIGQTGTLTSFSISQLSFTLTSSDPILDLNFVAGSYDYGSGYVGLNYGPDGIKGTGDDFFVTSGPNTQLVNELFGRGSGNAFEAICIGCTLAQQQAEIDAVAAYINGQGGISMTGTYSLGQATGSGTLQVVATPEPTTMFLLGTGLAALGASIRKKRRARKIGK